MPRVDIDLYSATTGTRLTRVLRPVVVPDVYTGDSLTFKIRDVDATATPTDDSGTSAFAFSAFLVGVATGELFASATATIGTGDDDDGWLVTLSLATSEIRQAVIDGASLGFELLRTPENEAAETILQDLLNVKLSSFSATQEAATSATIVRRGRANIASGLSLIRVTFARPFAVVPELGQPSIIKPGVDSDNIAVVSVYSVDIYGFNAELSGATPTTGYKISYTAVASGTDSDAVSSVAYVPSVTGYVGGTATDIDGWQTTAGLEVPRLYEFAIGDPRIRYGYELRTKTEDDTVDDEWIIEPADYDADTNNVIYARI